MLGFIFKKSSLDSLVVPVVMDSLRISFKASLGATGLDLANVGVAGSYKAMV